MTSDDLLIAGNPTFESITADVCTINEKKPPRMWWAIFSGLPQLLAAIPAYLAVKAFRPILPYAFGFAAGAMIFLVMSEMIPESRETEKQRVSSAVSGMFGFLAMMVLQNVLVF